ncbi:AraC family transcriptional regulator [Bradyrhizobium quebecense]|uniref:AraC family transcriptional regulator n=1 Tax=Bradyrhizobium quebecense TaxID=2748629 RepID=A0A973WQ99_9BRAD|nr:AraC family transcriptional regulator [Bradyrhizobium quebecense]UGA45658.1 AraC family transcriptional regulator [Bradyrhizobium quebecense]
MLDDRESLLSRSPVIRTGDPEEMRHALFTVYGASGFEVPDPDDFEGVANYLRLSNVGLGFCGYGAKTVVEFPEADFARLQIGLKGEAGVILGNKTTMPVNQQHVVITSPGQPTTIIFEPEFEQLILRIKAAALENALTTLLGAKPRTTLVFDPTAAPTQPSAQLLRELTLFLASQLNSTAAHLLKPMLLELEQALIVTLLSAHRHNFTDVLESPAKEPSPLVVRMAEEYIEANWTRAITIEDLASQTSTSIRSLYAAFRRSRGYTPMAFAKMVRLQRAKKMLQEANQRTSVSEIAFKCGFGNLGHFASDFRKLFGELPSEVLARTRGRL